MSSEKNKKRWFDKGLDERYKKYVNGNPANENANQFDGFICYWIAFNSLYGEKVSRINQEGKIEPISSEREQIKEFILPLDIDDYANIFLSESYTFFKETVINNCKPRAKGENNYIEDTSEYVKILNNKNKEPKEKLIALLKCIYQVRCNLFHGGKSIQHVPDTIIVKNSAEIMELFLKDYFEAKRKKYKERKKS